MHTGRAFNFASVVFLLGPAVCLAGAQSGSVPELRTGDVLLCEPYPYRTVTHTNVVAALVLNPVVIDRIERDGDSMLFHFKGQQLYDYTVEYTDSLTTPNWQTNSSYRAKLGPIDVVVTNSLSAAQTRYFRIRTEPCYCR